MKLTSFLVITLYSLSCFIIGGFLIYFSIGLITLPEIINSITRFYHSFVLNRLNTAIIGGLLISISILYVAHLLGGIFKKEKGILFNGESGVTTVSFSAIEDIIKRAGSQFLDIREIKPRVVVKRKGLDVSLNVVFYSGVSIPELTERMQSSIRDQLRDMLGIEGEIKVKIHIVKIIEKTKKELKKEGVTREMELGR